MAQIPDIDVTTVSVGGTAYTVPFEYQTQAEVFVTVDGSPVAFTWINAGNISITPAPAVGAAVRRYRSTAATSIRHDYRNGVPFTPKNIAENNDQLLYVVQEAVSTSVDALTQTQANTLLSEQALASAGAAVVTANAAEVTANTAAADAAAAVVTANNAEGNSTLALSTAAAAQTTAESALSTSSTNSTNITTLVGRVDSIDVGLGAAEAKLATIEPGAQVNVGTNITVTAFPAYVALTSSTGTGQGIPAADAAKAGVLLPAQFTKLEGIEAGAQVNVPTNLSMTSTSSSITVSSSTGDDIVLPAVSGTKAGLMLPYLFDKLVGIANNATANPNTDSLAEGASSKYFTEARVRLARMTGLAPVAGEAVATDSLLTVVSKLQTQATAATAAIGDMAAALDAINGEPI